MLELSFIILLATIPASFNFFLDYCFGKPMSNEPSLKAVFSFYSLALAKARLKKMNKLNPIVMMFKNQLDSDEEAVRLDGKEQLEKSILLTAQKYFFWEQPFGMCPFCTNFWCSIIAAGVMFFTVPLTFIHPMFLFLFIPIFSHTILRKLLN